MLKDKPELKLQEMDGYNMLALRNNTKLVHNDNILAFVNFEDDAKKIKLSKDDFLKYDAEWKSGKFEDKNLNTRDDSKQDIRIEMTFYI